MQRLIQLYKTWCGHEPADMEQIPKSGSNRHYFRLTSLGGGSVIGVVNHDVEENRCFIYLSGHFSERHLPVPEILAVSDDGSCYLQTDLGRQSLYDALRMGRDSGGSYSERETALVSSVIRLLPHLQVEGADGLDEQCLLSPNVFNEQAAMFDLNYFKYCFLKTTDLALMKSPCRRILTASPATSSAWLVCPPTMRGSPSRPFSIVISKPAMSCCGRQTLHLAS